MDFGVIPKAHQLVYAILLQLPCRFTGALELYFEATSAGDVEGVVRPPSFGAGAFVITLVENSGLASKSHNWANNIPLEDFVMSMSIRTCMAHRSSF